MNNLEGRIEALIANKAINIDTIRTFKINHRGFALLGKSVEPAVGDFCRGIVIGRDDSTKQLLLHLTFLQTEEGQQFINHLKCRGCIRDFDLKEDNSIFSYVANYKVTTLGTQILAQVRAISQRTDKKCFQMTLKYKKTDKNLHIEPGIIKDQIDVAQRDWKILNKYGCFSASFLAQYEPDFANPGLHHQYSKDLKLNENGSLNPDCLVPHLQRLGIDFQRVRHAQEKQWADYHFSEGLNHLKANHPNHALESLTLARQFDKKSSKICVARGCALANLNNLTEGLKEIKEALRLSPENKEAHQYLEQIRKQMRAKERKEIILEEDVDEGSKKIRLTNDYDLIKRR